MAVFAVDRYMTVTDSLEDWQLALLVEARRVDDPTVIEVADAELFRDYRDIIKEADSLDVPVVVERDEAQKLDRAESLIEAAEGIDTPRVVEETEWKAQQEACEAVRELLSDALETQHDLRGEVIDGMTAPQMVEQFRDEDDGLTFDGLSQQPESGGAAGEEPEDADPETPADAYESLDGNDRKEFRDKARRAQIMEKRTPKYADKLRTEAAEILGIETEEDELDAFVTEVL